MAEDGKLAAIARSDQALAVLAEFVPALMQQVGSSDRALGFVGQGDGSAVGILMGFIEALPREELEDVALQAIMQVALAHLRITELTS